MSRDKLGRRRWMLRAWDYVGHGFSELRRIKGTGGSVGGREIFCSVIRMLRYVVTQTDR